MDPAEQAIYIGLALGGRHEIRSHIGNGSFSGVFLATDHVTGDSVAVKILSFRSGSSPEARLEFDGEITILKTLASCSHIVNLRDHGSHPITLTAPTGSPVSFPVEFLVLDLADACLAELLISRHRLPWADRLRLFRDVVKGVHQMHLKRVVHRDLKSDNTLVFSTPQAAKVADFGRSRNLCEPARFIAEAYVAGRGDLRFAPPEFIWLCGAGGADEMARADLYLLGSLLFEVATGVGLTLLALPDAPAIMAAMDVLPEDARRAELALRRRELRDRFLPAYEVFASQVPGELRAPAVSLLTTLTDPDPANRLPGFRRRSLTPWDLGWVLHRVDVLLKLAGLLPSARPSRRRGLRHR